jgi:hypothetical protein
VRAIAVALVLAFLLVAAAPPSIDDAAFADLITRLSEPGGTFQPSGGYDSDNLVSNERSYQAPLAELTASGTAYLGVGPEQNFSYIAQLQPSIAFIVDLRRDNLLLQLMYKALFELSANRVAFVSRLFGRAVPGGLGPTVSVDVLMRRFAAARPSRAIASATSTAIAERLVHVHRLPLSGGDQQRIAAIYAEFVRQGPAIRWSRDRMSWLPTFTDLMTMRGSDGTARSFLVSEERFAVVKRMEERNLVVPVVGDFAGPTTMRGIAAELRHRGVTVGAFYTSNVEPYLKGDAWTRFVANVGELPVDANSVFIRTVFHVTTASARKPAYETSTSTASIRQWLGTWIPNP